jgi:hypothetical protein
MKPSEYEIIIEKLLDIIDDTYKDGILKEIPLLIKHKDDDITIFSLVIKGERDKGTPFYQGSSFTHIAKEYIQDNETVYAEMVAQTSKQRKEDL